MNKPGQKEKYQPANAFSLLPACSASYPYTPARPSQGGTVVGGIVMQKIRMLTQQLNQHIMLTICFLKSKKCQN
ncbi:hypothetical protein [Klebsiella pasteurii]|uniref:hypothetical protein n=1 Tax=Klebsiella pasteurii TaxID=2587529 RepID=UPI0029DE7FC9|nr:hypothetical protein [Klebsiella pasteurii]